MKRIIDTSLLEEHSLTILRRDFIAATHCAFCPRSLPTGKALILVHPQHGEVPAGTYCGPKWGVKSPEGIIDFTRRGLEEDATTAEEAEHSPTERTSETKGHSRTRLRAIEYLLLRTEKLPPLGFKSISHREFYALHSSHCDRGLKDAEVTRIHEIMHACEISKDPDIRTRSYDSLMLAYTYAYWIDRCLNDGSSKLLPNNIERLASFKKGLLKYKSLTVRQIEQLNRDLASAFGEKAPKLKTEAFVPFRPGTQKKAQLQSSLFPANDKIQ